MCGRRDSNPHAHKAEDFKSASVGFRAIPGRSQRVARKASSRPVLGRNLAGTFRVMPGLITQELQMAARLTVTVSHPKDKRKGVAFGVLGGFASAALWVAILLVQLR